MRAISTAVFSAFLAVTICGASAAYAAGNVLLPEDIRNNSNSTTTPNPNSNLGLTPQTPAQPSAPNVPSVPNLPAQTDEPTVTATPDPNMMPSTTGIAPAQAATIAPLAKIPDTPVSPHIFRVPDMGPMQSFNDPNLPHSLNVKIADQSMWSSTDITAISQRLGIATDKVASLCHLSLGGILKTDKGIYMLDTGVTAATTVRYDGNVTGAMLSSKALCDQLPMTPSTGFIMQIGNKYSLPLQGVTCPANVKTPQSLTVLFPRQGSPQCSLQ